MWRLRHLGDGGEQVCEKGEGAVRRLRRTRVSVDDTEDNDGG